MAVSPRTRDYQRQQRALRALTYADVVALWPRLDLERLDDTFEAFVAAVVAVVTVRRRVAAALARAYLSGLRVAAAPPGASAPVPDPPLATARLIVDVRIASVVSVKRAMVAGRSVDLASRNALVNTMGAADTAVSDAGRDLIWASVEADPEASGWRRVTSGGCDFCRKLADGSVMPASYRMPRHKHCQCVPEPVFSTS